MKKILVFIFSAFSSLCFCATFNDIPFDEAFSEMMFSGEDVEPIEAEFYSQSAIVKDFFESVPADFVVTPEFKLANDDIENLEFKYSLRIENKNNLFFIHDFTLDETGLHGTAEFGVNLNQNPHYSYAVLVFENFCIQHDGTFESGISKLGLGTVEGVADFWLEDSYLKKDGDSYVVVCKNPFIDSAAFYNGERLHVGETVFDMDFNIISSEVYDVTQSYDTDELGYGVTLTSIKWDGESFYANGQLRIPGLDLYAEFNNYEIFIGYAEFYTENAESEYTFKYEDYTFFGKNVSMNPLEVRLADAGIIWNDKKIPFGDLVFSFYYDNWDLETECSFSSDEDDDVDDYAHILYDDDYILGYEFDYDGLFLYIRSKFPKGSGQALSYKLAAYPDGRFEPVLDGYYKKVFYCGNTNVSSSLMNVDTEMWELYDADVALPYNSCLTDLTISNLKLFYDGTIEHGNAVGKSEFCGMNYFIDELTFVDDGIITSGILQLPSSLLSSYSSLNLTVEKLYIGFDGSVKELVTRSSDARGCALSDSFWLVSKGCHIEVEQTRNDDGSLNAAKCWLCLDDSTLQMPNGYQASSAISVENVKYDLAATAGVNGFYFDEAVISGGLEMDFSGMELFVVDGKVAKAPSMSNDGTVAGANANNYFQFTGTLTLPNDEAVPEFLRGVRAPAVIGVDFDGKICKSDVALGAIEGSLLTSEDDITAFTLGSTAAHFEISELDGSCLALVADSGALVFTDALPAWLTGKEVRLESFVYDFSVMRYTSLSGMQYLWDVPAITPEMTGVYAAVDYSYVNPEEDSLIAVSGSLVSPAPITWGDGTPVSKEATGTFAFDNDGSLKNFIIKYDE
ncbi:MAG: hypothetical protein J5747_01640 [Spirochaetaceae bacterium]|nr:hypothetical protein [Spirochaetaceae bacterium]